MIYSWTEEEATKLYQKIINVQTDVSVTRKRLEIVEQKPDYMIYINKLQKQVKTLESARERQIELNSQLLKAKPTASLWDRIFKV